MKLEIRSIYYKETKLIFKDVPEKKEQVLISIISKDKILARGTFFKEEIKRVARGL